MASWVKDYPLKLLPSGDIDVKDYHKALLTVREWFVKKNGGYMIGVDGF